DPMRRVSDTLDANPEAREYWDSAIDGLADVLLETEPDGMGGARFTKAGGPVLATLAMREMREAWLEEEAAGTRSAWLRTELPTDTADLFAGRGLRASLQLFDHIDNTEGGADLLKAAALHLMEHDAV